MLVPQAFADVVASTPIELDRGCLTIAGELRSEPVDMSQQLDRLDQMAAAMPEPTLDGLTRLLFDDLGFQGDTDDYYDPRNSYLDVVLDRRRGIPISLSVLCIEVGRRSGVPLVGIGLPGHFLVRDQVDQSLYLDPFRRGTRLTLAQCQTLFTRLHGADAVFEPAMVDPVGAVEILTRVLVNLRMVFMSVGDRSRLARVLGMLCGIPGVAPGLVRDASNLLTSIGRFDQAAHAADLLVVIEPDHADEHEARALRLRARMN
ncbi:MAG: SirB1 family protein [Acidimicrobiales bacterium]